MKSVAMVLALTLAMFCPQIVFAQSSGNSDWLIGTWEGALVGYPDKSGPNRSLKILSIAPNGTAQGTWFITGQDEYLAKINVVDGQRLKVLSVANSAIELTRQEENQLAGSFTLANGRTYQIALAKVSGLPEPAVASLARELVGRWEGEIRNRYATRDSPARTLYVDSVNVQDGKLAVQARYGITGKGMSRVAIEVLEAGKTPAIQFLTNSGSTVSLRRFGQKGLIGTIRYRGTSQNLDNQEPMNLERVE